MYIIRRPITLLACPLITDFEIGYSQFVYNILGKSRDLKLPCTKIKIYIDLKLPVDWCEDMLDVSRF